MIAHIAFFVGIWLCLLGIYYSISLVSKDFAEFLRQNHKFGTDDEIDAFLRQHVGLYPVWIQAVVYFVVMGMILPIIALLSIIVFVPPMLGTLAIGCVHFVRR